VSLGVHIQMQLLRAKRADCATEDEVALLTGYYESTGSRLMLRLIPVLIRSLTNDAIPIQRRCVLTTHHLHRRRCVGLWHDSTRLG
jgi:hypothetical protein